LEDPDELTLAAEAGRPLGLRILAGVGALAFILIAVNLLVVVVRLIRDPSPLAPPRPLPPTALGAGALTAQGPSR
jgi:hypothetical protein